MTSASDIPMYRLNLARRPDRRLQEWQQFRRDRLSFEKVVGFARGHMASQEDRPFGAEMGEWGNGDGGNGGMVLVCKI